MRLGSKTILAVLGAAFCAMTAALPAAAQSVQRIAAIVNDDVISAFDLESRLSLVIVSTNLTDSPEVRSRIAPQVLRTLIDERLQLQEAKRRNISVAQREINRAVAAIEKQNKLSKGGLFGYMESNGVNREAIISQIRANIAWQKLLGRRIRPRITIGEDEIDETLERIKSRQGQMEFRLSEVVLAVDSPDEEANVRNTAERIIDQVRRGARFSAIARQFSQSATAAVGGDLGWLHESELDPATRSAVANAQVGTLLPPVKTVYGYRLLALQDRRRIAAADSSDVEVDLRQIMIPLPDGAGKTEIESQIGLAKTIKGSAANCPDFALLAKEVNSPLPPTLGKFKLGDLSSTVRGVVQGLDEGGISDPVKLNDGILLLMVCDRKGDAKAANLPKRDEISDRLLRERMALSARRYLRDIRLSAVVDIRV